MNIPSFNSLNAELAPVLAEIEEKRKRIIKETGRKLLWVVLILLVLALAIGLVADVLVAALIVGGIACFFAFWLMYAPGKEEVSDYYKKHIIAPFVHAMFEEGSFAPDQGIASGVFMSSGLFSAPDRYHSEDLICGKQGNTQLSFSEVHAEEKHTRTDSKGHTHTSWVTLFKGFIFVADFHKHFKTRTLVYRNQLIAFKKSRVKLEDPDFERRFDVYCSDQVEARYILSPSMMQRMRELDDRFGKKLQFSFNNSKILIAISDSRNYFETGLWSPIKLEVLRTEYEMLRAFASIVEDLNLNLRIWSKE